ncbi:hypothetical protein H9Y04_45435 [Streptomyces sp. TRM66268-LWL]|uniref:Uncharacterized protein n=1 Tax=Streptomyces polyasparticus TaxID=2767826 RepID=A0ABR7SW27_9ACTN|nr:hypothetical protein [Streptomyces polyasparticus]MBC9719721.1 hypothetical protein [Streptomyces polyasparticus]
MTEPDLAELGKRAAEFADELTTTLRSVLPDAPQYVAHVRGKGRKPHIAVMALNPDTRQAVPAVLTIAGAPRIDLHARYYCWWDRDHDYLAVDNSRIAIHAHNSSEPLFRHEYERAQQSYPPGAHLHVHAHRDESAYLMLIADRHRPAERNAHRTSSFPRMADLHFPVGGHRFRPCLEEILYGLIEEYGVDTVDHTWSDTLRNSIRQWRIRQLRAAVRDEPDTAADLLRSLGYAVHVPEHAPRASFTSGIDRL